MEHQAAPEPSPALARWRERLEGWAIPDPILDAAPVSPWGFDVATFARRAEQEAGSDTPSVRRALEALPAGGTVLDVGCGAGAAGLALAGRAGRVAGVDESAGMLAAFAARADGLGVAHDDIEGRWPEVAAAAPEADVVVCAHVLHNVPDLGPFATALTAHARGRVVVELPTTHPLAWLRPYWRTLHGWEPPDGPTDEDAVAALAELGIAARVERWEGPGLWRDPDDVLALLRRRLCLGADRDPELRAALARYGAPQHRLVATLWWPGAR